jgi:hypothetical protein
MLSRLKPFTVIAAMILAITTASSALAAITYSVEFRDHYGVAGGLENSYISSGVPGYNIQGERLCTSLSDPNCALTATIFAVLPYCQSASEGNCVEALAVTTPRVASGAATYLRTVGNKVFEADPANGLPAGANWSLFEVPGLKSAGVQSTFGVKVRVELQRIPVVGVKATSFSAIVTPYEIGTTTAADSVLSNFINPLGRSSIRGTGGDITCLWVKAGECGREKAFPADATVTLKVRIGNYLTSWLHGRVAEPTVSIAPLDQRQNVLTVSGKPVVVPGVKGNATTEIIPGKTPLQNGGGIKYDSSQDNSLDQFLFFENFFNKKATVLDEVWSFRSLGLESVASAAADNLGVSNPLGSISSVLGGGGASNPLTSGTGSKSISDLTGLGASAAKCVPEASQVIGAILGTDSVSSLIGLVTTNSLTYAAGPPKYTDGFLNYKVAGLHLNPDGSVFQGSYDLVMSSKIARCIYGFEGTGPLYATVSVVNSDGGETTLATESVKEEGGWLRLKARGFTFSSPTLKIKLTQNAPTAPTQPAKSEVTAPAAESKKSAAAPAKRISITCVKGKITRKVSGTAPKCPTGFKKR